MLRPVFAANWKMNNGPTAAVEFMRSFISVYPKQNDRTVIFFPPALSVAPVRAAVRERADLLLGVQNIHWEAQGAFTGEISASMARDAGATVVLVGHSERRHVFGETDEECGKKVVAAEKAGLTPMLCVGEKLEERERGETESVVLRQLRAGLSGLSAPHSGPLLIAYEPVWAIGTGKTATPADAAAVHRVLRAELSAFAGEKAGRVPILYGGSVNQGNASALLAAENVDGLLVGGASLDPNTWLSITTA
ncbi:MAG: triose-phosphate isomerase [Gemmatimonadaceae bacterium]|nr:triose-phosphate isomerase [Gemmatimonadaceae bacterium]